MRGILEKHLLLLTGIGLLVANNDLYIAGDYNIVISFLIGIIFTEASLIVSNKKLLFLMAVVYFVCCVFYWPLFFYMPVLIFSMIEMEFYYGLIGCILVVIAYDKFQSVEYFAFLLICMLLSAALSFENKEAGKYRKKYLEMMDSSTELESRLRKKNKALLENQDANIHLATLQERNRIAREIHDNVGHMLSRTILQMGALMTVHSEEPLHGQLESVNDTLNEAMNNIRESVHDLHNESLDLKLAVEDAVKDMKEKYLVKIDYDMSKDVPRNIKYCFIAIIKEALANVVKHSDANKVLILMREHPGFYQLIIEDNGSAKDKKSEEGIGLSNMEDRVSSLMGNIRFSDEKGFKINISIPKLKE